MADETKTSTRRPRRWLRWIGISLGTLVLLLVVAYFVGTSEWAFKSIILPKVSTAMNAQVTVEGANLSPFSAVTLRGLKVATKGAEPLVTAQEVRARYSLMDIIKGNIHVSEVALESPVVNLVTFADGTSNLDPITKEKEAKEPREKKKEEKKDGEPTKVNLQKFLLNNATVRKVTERKDGTRELIELTGVNITADDIANGKTGQFGLAANVRFDQGPKTATNGVLAARVGGSFNFTLDAALKPQVLKGQTKVDVTEAKGAFEQVAALGVTLNADLTPAQLNDVSVRFTKGGNNLGAIAASGPFSAETMEGRLAVSISQIDRQVLNLAGAALGIDFNQTAINSTNTVELAQRGRVINVNGALLVGNFSVTQKGQTTPALDVRSAYAVTYDQTNRTALVQQFALAGTQNQAEFLRGTLARPMLLDLGKGSNAVDESAFDLVVTNFNLPDWQAFLGTNATVSSGKLGLTLNLVSQQAGKKLALNLTTQLRDLTAVAGSNRIENADLSFATRGTVSDFSAVNLEQYRAELARGGQPALAANGALQYDTKTQNADVQANLETSLPQVTSLVSVPGLSLSAGTVKFAGRIQQTSKGTTNAPVLDRNVAGKLNVEELTGAFQSNRFDRFATAAEIDVAMRGSALEIKKCSGSLHQSGQPGGTFDLSGNLNLSNQIGQITAKLADLNQHALKSFVAAALGEKQLESVTIDATTTAKLDGPQDRSVKAELRVANLVVNDPSGAVPKTPLAVDAVADVAQAKGVLDLRQVQLALTKTERAPNALTVAGRLDLSKSNAWTGSVKVTSDGLDVTPYYEIFAGNKSKPAAARKDTKQPRNLPTEPAIETEPAPVNLPFTQFAADVNIAKFFLREVAISNLVTKATLENGRANLNPVSLTLNGAPVTLTASANLSVPGYEYDVNAKLDRVPAEPLVNTFAPERRGQFKGLMLTSAQIKGAGITGPNLRKNLAGQFGFTLTNAEVQVTTYKWLQKVLKPLATVLQLPELAQSPLSWIDASAGVANGTVTLTNATAESSLFRAGLASGTVTLKDVLTNSTINNLPVRIELRRSLVSRVKFLEAVGAPSGDFLTLPHFYTLGGTIGEPNPHIDYVAVGKWGLTQGLRQLGGKDLNRTLDALGLGGGTKPAAPTNAPATNAPGTNAPATNAQPTILDVLPGLFQKQPKNEPPKTNAPAQRRRRSNP